jgi:anaerobic magnesium-protoporphyrin IX monomethyl ester cyclase
LNDDRIIGTALMKVTLVNPPGKLDREYNFRFDNPKDNRGDRSYSYSIPPIGLAYVAASLRQAGHDVHVIDAFAERLTGDEVAGRIAEESPEYVGISCLTTSMPFANRLAKEVKEATGAYVVLGGIHPTIFPEKTLENGDIDFVIRGEGEIAFPALIDAVEGRRGIGEVYGLAYRDGKGVRAGRTVEVKDLDCLPYPAWDLFPRERYDSVSMRGRVGILSIASSRGCPYRCIFCTASNRYVGGTYRVRDPKKVADEMAYMREKYGVREFIFTDPLFPAGKAGGDALCDELIARGIEARWAAEIRAGSAGLDSLRKMKAAGCGTVALGVESGNQRILDGLCKGIRLEEVDETVAHAKSAGLDTLCFFLFGSPSDTAETMSETVEYAKRLDPHMVRFIPVILFPGTELFDKAVAGGRVAQDVWDKYVRDQTEIPLLLPDGIGRKDLIDFVAGAYWRFYMRPGKIAGYARRVKSPSDLLKYARYCLFTVLERLKAP